MLDASKLERWQHFCRAKGWTYPSPAERLVERLTGAPGRPWIFWPSWAVGLVGGLVAALIGFAIDFRSGLVGGLVFGIIVAIVHSNQKNKYGLPDWEDF